MWRIRQVSCLETEKEQAETGLACVAFREMERGNSRDAGIANQNNALVWYGWGRAQNSVLLRACKAGGKQ